MLRLRRVGRWLRYMGLGGRLKDEGSRGRGGRRIGWVGRAEGVIRIHHREMTGGRMLV